MWLVILILLWGLNFIAFLWGISIDNPMWPLNLMALIGLGFAIGLESDNYR